MGWASAPCTGTVHAQQLRQMMCSATSPPFLAAPNAFQLPSVCARNQVDIIATPPSTTTPPPQLTRRGNAAICASFAESRINSTLKIKRLRLLYKNYVTGVMRNAQPSEHHPHRLMGGKKKIKKSLPIRVTCQLNTKLKPDYSALRTAGEHCSEMLDRSTERDGL